MLTTALLLVSCAGRQTVDVREIDRLAQARDVAGLQRFMAGEAPLSVLKTNGAYEGGRFGWHAVEMVGPKQHRFIVLTTPLTGEDVGELLFSVEDGRLRYIPETDPMEMTIARQDLTADFDLTAATVRVVAKVTLEPEKGKGERAPTSASPMAVARPGFALRLGPNYKVSSIVGADGKAVTFTQAGGIVWLFRLREAGVLTLRYEGVVNRPQYAGSIDAGHIQLSNEFWYPSIARGPAPYTLSVKVPDGWTAVGQGERSERDGRVVFDMRLPTSVWSFSAEPFRTFTRKDRTGRFYDVYSSRLAEEQMRRQTELSEPILDFYSRSFAPYPFSRWGAADVRTYGGGALEAYSFATYGSGLLPDEDAHEPSHTWWGGILPNTYLRSFWNESFAVWSEGLYQRNAPIGDPLARRDAFADEAMPDESYDRVPVAAGSCFIGPEASSLGYGKGSHVLAMLEQLLGTDQMLAACREWIKVHPRGHAAEWEEFEATVLRMYPTLQLQSFFNDWLRKPGSATVSVQSVKWDGGKLVGKMSPAPWRMPLEFVLVSATGTTERRMLDTRNVSPTGDFTIPSGMGKPVRVLFDPFHRALRHGPAAPSTSAFSVMRGYRVYRDPSTPDYIQISGTKLDAVPANLERTILIGHPRTTPAMAPLLAKVGMSVTGDTLTWRNTSIDLKRAGAIAIVDLEGGGRCAVVLGTATGRPNIGRASLALFDPLGRFLTGITPLPEPKDGVFRID